MSISCIIVDSSANGLLVMLLGDHHPILKLACYDKYLVLYSGEIDFEQLGLPEASYKSFFLSDGVDSRIGGALANNTFDADIEVRVSIYMDSAIESRFMAFLEDNPFMKFKDVGRRQATGALVGYEAWTKLSSNTFRDLRHELPFFALRSGPEVEQNVYVEVFNEDGGVLHFGCLTPPILTSPKVAFTFVDPSIGYSFRITSIPSA